MLNRLRRKNLRRKRERIRRPELVASTFLNHGRKAVTALSYIKNLQPQLHLQPVRQCLSLGKTVGIERHDLSPRVVWALIVPIRSTKSMARTIRESVELVVIGVLGVESQAIK